MASCINGRASPGESHRLYRYHVQPICGHQQERLPPKSSLPSATDFISGSSNKLAMTSTMPAKPSPLDFMDQLSSNVFYLPPTSPAIDPSAPRLIVFLSWMGAKDGHIVKYVNCFRELYPSSPLILGRFPLHYSFNNHKVRREMKQVLNVITSTFPPEKYDVGDSDSDSEGECGDEKSRLLFHVMSNGGAISFRHLVEVATKRGLALPLHSMILDSSPGKFHWNDTHEAFAAVMPRWMSPAVHPIMAAAMVMNTVMVLEPVPQTKMFEALNSEGAIKTQKRRTYLLSGADRIIAAEDVIEHGETARGKGLAVRFENFGDSKHVQHMKNDPERYWAVVKETWEGI